MKKLNLFELGLRRVLFLLLSMLGFTSCVKDSPCEYGSPVANFKVVGQVTNENGTGIPNIGVVFETEGYQISDTLRTDANGLYSREFQMYPPSVIDAKFVDTDGAANGSYESKTVSHTLTDGQQKGSWTIDYKEQKIDATLTEKENN
ncbi:MAG TPA: radical SAM-associated putative lipoprotein [Bacteroidaceae bacterium]|nr:radical SAM-associated putative lipoprotein [Bacteroidaceae bacterium]